MSRLHPDRPISAPSVVALLARKDLVGGLLVAGIGIAAIIIATGYGIGSPSSMGPGFFPAAVGAIMTASGLAVGLTSLSSTELPAIALRPEWRGWICIVIGMVLFIVLGQRFGLLPATFALVSVSALGERGNGVRTALLLAAAICVVAVVVFWWLLQVQFPLLTWS